MSIDTTIGLAILSFFFLFIRWIGGKFDDIDKRFADLMQRFEDTRFDLMPKEDCAAKMKELARRIERLEGQRGNA